ncbi:hypothetical protein [Candidatus Clostridium stratigraminis]|uniref:hypothetical protein n=1 Tax=Candidatus Clostridium stratigraminis TaxID=3381661 RepID=UPI003877FF3C
MLILKKDKENYSEENLDSRLQVNLDKLDHEDIKNINHDLRRKVLEKELKLNNTILGFICFDGNIVHYSCIAVSDHKIGEIEQDFIIPSNSIYIYNCFTEEKYRGLKLFQRMLSSINNMHSSEDKYVAVSPNNIPSYKAIENVGFYKVAQFKYKKILIWKKLYVRHLNEDLIHAFKQSV